MELDDLRKQVDELDGRIVRLINERAGVARKIGEVKAQQGGTFYSPSREAAVYERIESHNEGPLSNECIRAVYREIIGGCLALEAPLKIAYLGPAGTFTHAAARSRFGESVEYIHAATIDDVFTDVERGRADYGVVPIENSTDGGIHETMTRFLNSPLKACAEIVKEIHHTLMSLGSAEEVKRIYSRPQVFAQTRRWLQTHMSDVELIGVSSTSAAAERAAAEADSAAIGSTSLAAAHGLKVLFEGLEDYAHNVTRFYVVGQHMGEPTGDDKTALLCRIRDRSGALRDLLSPFTEHGINMTRIESFPSPTEAWQYFFFIDLIGHPEEPATKEALEEMAPQCEELKVLGAFPQAKG